MATIQLSEKKIKALVREEVQGALKAEFMKLRALAAPFVSDAEQRDIERRYKAPSQKVAATHTVKL